MANAVSTTVVDAHALAFHSEANISLGCLQVRGLFWPLSCSHFQRDYFEDARANLLKLRESVRGKKPRSPQSRLDLL